MMMDNVVLLTGFVLYFVLELISIGSVWYRRHHQPLKFRDPFLLIAAESVTFITMLCNDTMLIMRPMNCWIEELLVTPWMLMMPLLITRFWKLLLASHMTSARLSADYQSWFLRHAWLGTRRYIYAAILSVFLVLAVIHYSVASTSPGCFFSPAAFLVQTVFLISWLITIAAMALYLRSIRDAFCVVAELKMLAVLILIADLLVIAFQIMKSHDQIVYTFLVYGPIQNLIQIWFPVWKSYSGQFSSDFPKGARISPRSATHSDRCLNTEAGFRQLLIDKDGFQALKSFMTVEFSVENLMCWQELSRLQSNHNPAEVNDLFDEIYQVYVRDGAPNQVNISSGLKKRFRDVMETRNVPISIMVPDQAGEKRTESDHEIKLRLLKWLDDEIVELIRLDSYQRFRRTPQYAMLAKR